MSRPAFFAVLAFLVGAALVAGPAPVRAQLTNGDIVFTTGRGSEVFEIWAVDPDPPTAPPKQVIGGPPGSIEVDPDVNTAGTQIAFARKSNTDETFDLMVKTLNPPAAAVKITDE